MIDTADSVFVLFSAIIVLFMTPALAIFYAGLANKSLAPTMLMQNFFAIPLLTVVWALLGFSLAFGDNALGGFVGGIDFMFLQADFTAASDLAPAIPLALFFVLQATFAIITPALMTGAVLGRTRILPLSLFLVLWSLLIYCPVVHWVWGGGFLSQLGYFDFAGGVPVHMIAGFSALAAVLALGSRSKPKDGPSSLPLVAIGAGILWIGWFSFNSSGALTAGDPTPLIIMNTLLASSVG
ncbi:MAG: ammonium transporter, partial [Bacillota bacterium]|nr:ammonium transporter [Bacillota bacterium]